LTPISPGCIWLTDGTCPETVELCILFICYPHMGN
jgi:hypothetical protein